MDLRFAFLVLEEHPYGREMLRILLKRKFRPGLIIEEVSPVADEERHKFLTRIAGQAVPSTIAQLVRELELDPAKVAAYDEAKIEELLQNPGIVRNRQKIAAAVTNAQAFLEIRRQPGGFDRYLWDFVGGRPIVNRWRTLAEVPAQTPESAAMSPHSIVPSTWFATPAPTVTYLLSMT